MTSLCLLIVFANLLYSSEQAPYISPFRPKNERIYERVQMIDSITFENQDEYLANMISPYWNITYDEQLVIKQKMCNEFVDILVKTSRTWMIPIRYKLLRIIPSVCKSSAPLKINLSLVFQYL